MRLSFLLLYVGGVAAAWAQAPESDPGRRVDALFSAYAGDSTPGCALNVIHDGATVYEKGYGKANLAFGVPIAPQSTVFDIGSASKQFTAAAILLLVQDGKLALSDDIRRHLPELPDYRELIAIDHLLYHTSGLRDFTVLMTMGTGVREVDYRSTEDAWSVILRQKRLNHSPGAKFIYSNTNYFLLGQIVERVSGKGLGEFLQERIFRPLGMRQTFVRDRHDLVVPQFAPSYASAPGGAYTQKDINWEFTGSSSVLSTVADRAKWDRNFDEPRVGGEWLVQHLQQNGTRSDGVKLDLGRGLFLDRQYRGMRAVHHAGSTAGYRAQFFRLPEERFAAIVLCNADDANAPLLSFKVADVFLADSIRKRRAAAANAPAAPAIAAASLALPGRPDYAGTYVDRYDQGLHTVEFSDGKLWYSAPRQKSLALQALGDRRFSLPGKGGGSLEFFKQGRRRLLTVARGSGEPAELERVRPLPAGPQSLNDYLGTYSSAEIDTRWTFVARDGRLYKQAGRETDKPMEAAFEDAFTVAEDSELIRFTRDAHRRITGFTVDNPRVLDILFRKER
ncbi:beta-lactamase family protein [Massilia sp. IC2-477]|uniref:serine hydrolase domain-containing protein n=1 Tax=Massilia sp. IC2-477 TaxID=2887198 RepID=UPI001D10BFF2|nr:serine hydrolase domain-containing protein [Massilia sp. IC2-477]MCC2956045.1 beta-lactamase family protein [Massilia sp. IC2-477]